MASLPRATCPACRSSVPVRRNGALREHRPRAAAHMAAAVCPGSGEKLEDWCGYPAACPDGPDSHVKTPGCDRPWPGAEAASHA